MKIVQINAVYGVGSTGRIAQDIAHALKAQGHENHIFWAISCRADENAAFYRIGSTLDHKLHALLRRLDGKQGWHSKAATRKLCRELLKIKPDVVHLHNLHSNYIHLPLLLQFLGENKIPTLITLHDNWMHTSGFCTYYSLHNCNQWDKGCTDCPAVDKHLRKSGAKMYRIKEELYSRIPNLAVNGVSRWTAEAAKQSMLRCAKINTHIYNWIDTQAFKPQENAAEVREKYGIPENHKLILGVSQGWSERKGLQEFLQLADVLKDEATVILVGQDNGVPKKENLRCIGFTNNRQELIDLYSAADLFVNPSRAETFGLVTAEAMSCGTPVVAYNNTGSAELVAPQCGALATDGDAAALVTLTRKLLESQKETYSAACRQWVLENFNKQTQLQKYVELYEKILSFKKSEE
ncbi:MAG: glycosyltransferase [Oscillospiraceae bacterium]|nr:glycosyltransferase [Oscillospiraceae bacterium]